MYLGIAGYRLFAHDDMFTYKEFDLATRTKLPASQIISKQASVLL